MYKVPPVPASGLNRFSMFMENKVVCTGLEML